MLPKNPKTITHIGSTVSSAPYKPAMSTQLENPGFDNSYFQYHLPQIYRTILKEFRRIVRSFVRFNFIFAILLSAQLFFFIPFITSSAMAALMLGALFLTCFSYVVLLFYRQARKPEQLLHLRSQFLQSCRQHISFSPGDAQHHLSIAEALRKLTEYLHDFEANFYKIPSPFQFLTPILNRFSTYCYGEDVFKMKRLLLQAAVEEHLKQIRSTPTDLEVHASLAGTYVVVSKLYRDRVTTSNGKSQELLNESYRSAARLAIEEFRILNHYAPNDPWVHEQLAAGYGELDMPEEELSEMETLMKLKPQDKEILFHLGTLYFQQGMNAKGLQVYEELKQSNFKKAEALIASYGLPSSKKPS